MEEIKLTQFSHGAGCGCKISPSNLEVILQSFQSFPKNPKLLVGYESRDDAAVYEIDHGMAIISTTDFFMPIVDSPFDFGRIASTNAISDVYAMGGNPLMAIAILGWPVNKIPLEHARLVVEGARNTCATAGIPLAGGHSIDSPEPIFGLAVTGIVPKDFIKRNDTAQEGDILFLTKPLGIGILSTAQKKGILDPVHLQIMVQTMCTLNSVGSLLGPMDGVHAMTDITGFGLLGHLLEMCLGSKVSAILDMAAINKLPGIDFYLDQSAYPGGSIRNWDSYGHQVMNLNERDRLILADPQTSGGLLIAVDPLEADTIKELLIEENLIADPIGIIVKSTSPIVSVR